MSISQQTSTFSTKGDSHTDTPDKTVPPVRALPAPGEGTTTLDVSGGGATVKLDHLGPLVINSDGTMSRIGNWAEMAPIERENTLRVLGRRNKERLNALKKAKGEEGTEE